MKTGSKVNTDIYLQVIGTGMSAIVGTDFTPEDDAVICNLGNHRIWPYMDGRKSYARR